MASGLWRANLTLEELKDFCVCRYLWNLWCRAASLCPKSNSVPWCNGAVKAQATTCTERSTRAWG